MTSRQETNYLRCRALRVINDDAGVYSMMTRTLAIGVLELLEKRDQGAQLETDRVYAELAELRDELHTVAADIRSESARQAQANANELARLASITVAAPAWRRELARTADTIGELRVGLELLDTRVNAIARRVDQHTTTTDPTTAA